MLAKIVGHQLTPPPKKMLPSLGTVAFYSLMPIVWKNYVKRVLIVCTQTAFL